jgi:hypothetical protein
VHSCSSFTPWGSWADNHAGAADRDEGLDVRHSVTGRSSGCRGIDRDGSMTGKKVDGLLAISSYTRNPEFWCRRTHLRNWLALTPGLPDQARQRRARLQARLDQSALVHRIEAAPGAADVYDLARAES